MSYMVIVDGSKKNSDPKFVDAVDWCTKVETLTGKNGMPELM